MKESNKTKMIRRMLAIAARRKEGRGLSARRRSGTRTGSPKHFVEWKASAAAWRETERMRQALSRIPTSQFLTGEAISARAVDSLSRACATVWDLSRADLKTLKKLPGVGPATLRDVKAALAARSVPTTWEA